MRRYAVAAVLLVLCSMVLGPTLFREQVAQAAAAILPVKVVNTAAEAVPVAQQGTVTVAGTVALSPSANDVSIGADYAAAHTYSTSAGLTIGPNQLCGSQTGFNVPAGKRFVIEVVSGEYSSTFESGHKAQFF